MLGLPDKVRACLFDLDGVLTDTASVHTQGLEGDVRRLSANGPSAPGERFVPFDADGGLPQVRRRQEARRRRPVLSRQPRHRPARGRSRRRRRRRDRPRPGQPQERHVPEDPARRTASRCSRDRGATWRRSPPRASASPWCPRAPTPARCSRSPAWTSSSSSGSTASRCARSTSRASRHPTRSCAARSCSTSPPDAAAVFEDALSGVEAGRAGHFGFVVGVDRVGQADALRRNGADVGGHRSRRAAGHVMITDDAFPVEPWQVRETRLNLDLLAQSESLFALSNGHIGLRGNLDEGEPHGLPGHLPELVLRDPAAALRRGRASAIPKTARPSSTSPTARSCACWSTTSRSTSGTANCWSTNGFSTCAPAR